MIALARATSSMGASCSSRSPDATRARFVFAAPIRLRAEAAGGCAQARRAGVRVSVAASDLMEEGKFVLKNGMVDYYEILGVDDNAPPGEIKQAYRALAKQCHPDFLGDRGHDICIMLNEAYSCLTDPQARAAYNRDLQEALKDEEDDYTGEPLSKWIPASSPKMAKNENPLESRAVFVDECACIGCTYCNGIAPATFRMEPKHGRSRVFAQWLNAEDDIQAAIDSCPVSCIHWVERDQLAALEYVTRHKTDRVGVGIMGSSTNNTVSDPFDAAVSFLKQRKKKAEQAAKRARQYSTVQKEAYRAAAEAMKQETAGGWLGGAFNRMANNFAQQMAGSGMAMPQEKNVDPNAVGARIRSTPWQMRAQANGGDPNCASFDDLTIDGDLIPEDRSLVLASATSSMDAGDE